MTKHDHEFEHQSQDSRQSLSEQVDRIRQQRQEEMELSFLIGAPEPKHQPETD